MGHDAACTLTYSGKTTRGTAWLETKDLIFRGPERLAIPLAEITSATSRDGTLIVTFGTRTADFAIGAAAEKWAKRITNPPSRLDKLGVKPGMAVAVLGVSDPTFANELAARTTTKARATLPRDARTLDMIFYGASHRDALALERLTPLIAAIKPDGAIWIVRPKGRPEITEAETMAAGKRAGLVDVKVVSFSDTLTGEKFVIPLSLRAKLSLPRPAKPSLSKPVKPPLSGPAKLSLSGPAKLSLSGPAKPSLPRPAKLSLSGPAKPVPPKRPKVAKAGKKPASKRR
jgi:hypothetical protein